MTQNARQRYPEFMKRFHDQASKEFGQLEARIEPIARRTYSAALGPSAYGPHQQRESVVGSSADEYDKRTIRQVKTHDSIGREKGCKDVAAVH